MFEWRGREQGRADGQADARLNRPRRPRPNLLTAVLSNSYRDEYLIAYKDHYDGQRLQEEREQAHELAQKSNLIAGNAVPKDQMFERGWREGFAGKDTPPKGLSHDQIKTYERGHRLGSQHREYEMANQLRQKSRHQHSHGAQGNRGR
ncbi:MAG: hypothetical protein KUG74_10685 [Rhodobacteraceae bacterium]|nr:hypothetical protein [Paracoccaceae bacterium]